MPEIISPIDGQVAFRFAELSLPEALERLELAETVQRRWRQASVDERVGICMGMLDRYRDRLEENVTAIARMMGKPLQQGRNEFAGMVERTTVLARLAPGALADEPVVDDKPERRFIRHEPVGVVLDIAAWNFPLLIAINVVVPAVLAGNAVLIKHAPQTALVAEQLEQAFREAGAPKGLVQAFPVSHATAGGVIETGRVGFVAMTGSVRGGRQVYRRVAESTLTPVGLELGGKDAAVVLPDADFEYTVEQLVDGAFYNSGQSCCAIERIYVHEAIYDRFIEAYTAKTREYVVGNPLEGATTLGPVVNAEAAERVRRHVEQARAAGARVLVEEREVDRPDGACYVAPTVVDGVSHELAIMREETFGPTVGIMRFSELDAAVELANDSVYGLTASVWTTDMAEGERLATKLAAGTVFLNRCDYLDPALPWTGVKESGLGCTLSKYGFLPVTRRKSYHFRSR